MTKKISKWYTPEYHDVYRGREISRAAVAVKAFPSIIEKHPGLTREELCQLAGTVYGIKGARGKGRNRRIAFDLLVNTRIIVIKQGRVYPLRYRKEQ